MSPTHEIQQNFELLLLLCFLDVLGGFFGGFFVYITRGGFVFRIVGNIAVMNHTIFVFVLINLGRARGSKNQQG